MESLEGTNGIDGTLEGELDGFKETDDSDILERANEEGFIDTDGALEVFEARFDDGPVEIALGFDNADVVGEAVAGEAVSDAVVLAVGETVREVVGDTMGSSAGTLVGGVVVGAVRTSVGADATDAVGALVAAGAVVVADAGEGVSHLHFFVVFFGGSASLHFFLHAFFSFFSVSFFFSFFFFSSF